MILARGNMSPLGANVFWLVAVLQACRAYGAHPPETLNTHPACWFLGVLIATVEDACLPGAATDSREAAE
jgi:hypothetical protein